MKYFNLLLVTTFFILSNTPVTKAQTTGSIPVVNVIPALNLAITCSKTTNLVFPYKIKSVDRGSKDLLVQKANGVENVLQLKAGKENFEETNLSVITAEGKLYSFNVKYAAQPLTLNFRFPKDSNAIIEPDYAMVENTNEATLEKDAHYAIGHPRNVFGIRDKRYGINMRLTGLFVRHGIFYLKLQLENKSTIDYDIDMLHFFTKDKNQAKRTASQEIPINALYMLGNKDIIKSDTSQVLIVALPKFTIPDKKRFYVQMMERNGGRHLQLKMGNRKLINAVPVYNEQP